MSASAVADRSGSIVCVARSARRSSGRRRPSASSFSLVTCVDSCRILISFARSSSCCSIANRCESFAFARCSSSRRARPLSSVCMLATLRCRWAKRSAEVFCRSATLAASAASPCSCRSRSPCATSRSASRCASAAVAATILSCCVLRNSASVRSCALAFKSPFECSSAAVCPATSARIDSTCARHSTALCCAANSDASAARCASRSCSSNVEMYA